MYIIKNDLITSVKEEDVSEAPADFKLFQNFPNPFNPVTTISWQISKGSHTTIKVYDILGNEVAALVNAYRSAGKYETKFNAVNLSSGIYFYRIQAGSFTDTGKMILLR